MKTVLGIKSFHKTPEIFGMIKLLAVSQFMDDD